MHGSETVLNYAKQLAWAREWPLVLSECVTLGIVEVDPSAKRIRVHPQSAHVQLKDNASVFDSTVKV